MLYVGLIECRWQFKTREANGLILFNAGRERDFVAVELVDGHIHYVFDLGDGPVKIRDTSRPRLNDGKWHAVSIGRPAPKRHTLAVDDHVAAVTSQGNNENLDLDGILYIGNESVCFKYRSTFETREKKCWRIFSQYFQMTEIKITNSGSILFKLLELKKSIAIQNWRSVVWMNCQKLKSQRGEKNTVKLIKKKKNSKMFQFQKRITKHFSSQRKTQFL